MSSAATVAEALAYFEGCDDIRVLHALSAEIAPRARRAVNKLVATVGEELIPRPAAIRAANSPASESEAVALVRETTDFAQLQTLARAIGRRIEDIETVASVDFPEAVRVTVPAASEDSAAATGIVERTGTWLRVRLDSGETWEGPPSLARRGGIA